jgi:hypothetical protein
VTWVDAAGAVSRQELFLFEDYFVWDRSGGLHTGVAVEPLGSTGAKTSDGVAFDQDAVLRDKRLGNAADALAPYEGQDNFIGHMKRVITAASHGDDAREDVDDKAVSLQTVRLEELKAASQELLKRELEARLRAQRRNLWVFVGAVLLASGAVLLWLVHR